MKYTWIIWVCLLLGLVTWSLNLTRNITDQSEQLSQQIESQSALIKANMMFNLGYPRLKKFKGMKAGVDARDWQKAADEMVDSKWYYQVTNRAERLVSRMREV
jgi:GH24 family phage-related lysozyme (muramidase)